MPRGSYSARPQAAEARTRVGHWEADTMLGDGPSGPCALTLVERKTGYLALGKLAQRRASAVNPRAASLIRAQPRPVRTITADNGTEFHEYAALERLTGTRFYFAMPHHAWEHGTNENTNGLLRQDLPKGASMAHLTPAGLHPHRPPPQPPSPQTARLSYPGGMPCPITFSVALQT